MAGTPGLFGCTVSDNVPLAYGLGASNYDGARSAFYSLLSYTGPGAVKIFNNPSVYPTSPTAKMQSAINSGSRIYLCYQPGGGTLPSITLSSSERTSMVASINAMAAACAAAGTGATVAGIIPYQEVNNSSHHITATGTGSYVACLNYYGPQVRALTGAGFLGGTCRLGFAAGGGTPSQWKTYFQNAAQTCPFDFGEADYYGTAWKGGTRLDSGTNGGGAGNNLVTICNALGIPFGMLETGVSADGSTQLVTDTVSYIQYMQSVIVNQLAAGHNTLDNAWFDGQSGQPNVITAATDARVIAALKAFIAATTTGTSTPAAFTQVQDSANVAGAAGALGLWFNQGGGAAASTAGTLLVARIMTTTGSGTQTVSAPAGWSLLSDVQSGSGTGVGRVQQWAYRNNPGGLYGTVGAAAAFTYSASAAVVKGRITEWSSGAATAQYADTAAGASGASATTLGPVTGTASHGASLGTAAFGAAFSVAPAGQTWTTPGVTAAPYDVCNWQSGSGSLTLRAVVGTGSAGSPQGAAVGDLVVVAGSLSNNTNTITACTDSQGNTYTLANSDVATTEAHYHFASVLTHALVAGTDWIQLTYSATSSSKTLVASGCPGGVSATPDKHVSGHGGTGTAASSGSSGTLAQAVEFVVGSIADASAGGTPTGLSFGSGRTVSPANVLTGFYELTAATTAQTASGTLGASATWSALVTTFAVTPPAVGWVVDGTLNNLTGVYGMYSSPALPSGAQSVTGTISTLTNMTGWAASLATFYALPGTVTPVTVTTTTLPAGQVSAAYPSTALSAAGGTNPFTWAVTAGALPTGLGLSGAGVITGTPSVAGTASFTVTVTDATAGTATAALSIVVGAALSISTTSPLAGGTAAIPYGPVALVAAGGTSPYSWAAAGGSLAPGLGLSAAGVLSGVPVSAGTFTFTAKVTDALGFTATKSLAVTIAAGVLTITTASLAEATAGQPYTATFTEAGGGGPPFTWAVTSGALPAGVTLDPGTGILSGTPAVPGTYTFTITVSD